MMKKTLVTALAIAGMTTAGSALAWQDGELLVWINADKGYNGLQAVGDRFAADTGIPVNVQTPDAVTEAFQREAAIGQGQTSSFGRTTVLATGPSQACWQP